MSGNKKIRIWGGFELVIVRRSFLKGKCGWAQTKRPEDDFFVMTEGVWLNCVQQVKYPLSNFFLTNSKQLAI